MGKYFSNSIPGAMNIGADVDVYQVDSTQKLAIGTKFERADGAVFRYCHVGSASAAGMVMGPNLNLAPLGIYSANAVIASNSAFQQATEPAGMYPNMIGSKFVVLLRPSVTADQYAGSYLGISSGTGLGYTYRIKGNQASSGTSTILELYEKVKVAIDATADITVMPCKYANLMGAMAGNTQNALPVGALVAAVAATSAYAWVQTKGLASVPQSGTVTIGSHAIAALSQTDVGAVEQWGQDVAAATTGPLLLAEIDNAIVGRFALAGATSGHCVVDLTLD